MGKRDRQEDDDEPSNDPASTHSITKRRRSDGNGIGQSRKANTYGKRRGSTEVIEEQIKRGIKELSKTLKLAKGLERQKLGKRLKLASKNDDGALVERLSAEIQAVKVVLMERFVRE